jgi:L-malate glycosyltransferase
MHSAAEVHQILVGAARHDAITAMARSVRDQLARFVRSEIYAMHRAPDVDDIASLDDLPPARPGRVLVYHASIGEPSVTQLLLRRTERLVVVYHNITPPELAVRFDPRLAELLAWGRVELGLLSERAVLAVGVSEFNARELRSLGYTNVRVIPVGLDVKRLTRLDASPDMLRHVDEHARGPVVLAVGQLIPHKRVEDLIQAHHLLVDYLGREVTTIVVGRARAADYEAGLQRMLSRLGLAQFWLVGPRSDADLAALYRRASLFVTTSEHEGLCVPPLEAMSFGVPVVARAVAALPDTLGDAAMLYPGDGGPTHVAEAMHAVTSDRALASAMSRLGHRNLVRFDRARIDADWLDAVQEVVG